MHMTTHDGGERKPIFGLRPRDRERGRGQVVREERGGRKERGWPNDANRGLRFSASARSVLIFVMSLAACGFLAWWLWARFRIRFYFIFIPLVGIGGPIFGRTRRPVEDRKNDKDEEGGFR
jgi:hypothetical protein